MHLLQLNWVPWHIILYGFSVLHMLWIQHAFSKRLRCEGVSPGNLLHLEDQVPPSSYSVLLIFNIPFFELGAPMCLIYLCQENVVVFSLQYLLNQFEVCMILCSSFGKCRWTSTFIQKQDWGLVVDRKVEVRIAHSCVQSLCSWVMLKQFCAATRQSHHSVTSCPVWILGTAVALFSVYPSWRSWVRNTPGTDASKRSTDNPFLFTVFLFKPTLCNYYLPANTVIQALC